MRTRSWALGMLLSLASATTGGLLQSCAPAESESTGRAASFVVSGVAASVTRVAVTATPTGPGRTYSVDLVRVGDQWRGTLSRMQVGSYTFAATAYDTMGVALYQGATMLPANITDGATTVVALNLQQLRGPNPFRNNAPVITTFVASSADVTPGATVSLTATATDPDPGDTLSYAWTASGGTFSSTNALSTVWTAPMTEGNYDVTLTVSDNRGASTSTRYRVRVNASNGRGNAAIEITLMSAPEITAFSVGAPDASDTSALTVTATDPDGDALTYSWSSSCDGYFAGNMMNNRALANSASPTTTFTQAMPMAACTLSVEVSDPFGNRNTATIERAAGPVANTYPVVEPVFQSTMSASNGATVILRAEGSDPDGTPVTLSWTTSAGTLSVARDVTMMGGNRTEEVTWTAPSCFMPGTSATITVTVQDPGGLERAHSFTVNSGVASSALESDVNNCGACGNVCAVPMGGTATCSMGACSQSCPAGQTLSGGRCYDLQNDVNNCGSVGFVCPSLFSCRDSMCSTAVRDAFDPAIWPLLPGARWQFGWRSTPAPFSGFTTYNNRRNWMPGLVLSAVELGDNPSAMFWNSASVGPGGLSPNHVILHPGEMGLWSVVRFVAPVTGRYNIVWGLWGTTATTGVQIDWYENGTTLTSVDVSVSGGVASTGSRMNRRLVGDGYVDFGVNDGGNGPSSDSTTVDLRIEYLGP